MKAAAAAGTFEGELGHSQPHYFIPVPLRKHQPHQHEGGGYQLFHIISVTLLLLLLALSSFHYEGRLEGMEGRLRRLERAAAVDYYLSNLGLSGGIKGAQGKSDVAGNDRLKREAGPGGRRSQPWVESPPFVRNDEDETFFTRARDGSYVRPSGLREIYGRLPPAQPAAVQSPSSVQQPQLQTRSSSQFERYVQPPVEQLQFGGAGRSYQVPARVVRYNEHESDGHTVAAHYVADVSNFTSKDNPRLRNSDGIFQIWRPASWMKLGDFNLDSNDGVITVQKGGLYYIYAQIHYQDDQQNSFIVEVNGVPLLQCTTNQSSNNSCFTAGLSYLGGRDRIVIRNLGVDRFSIYKPEKSFFGMVRLGDQ